jgi:hypothetical protein
VDGRRCIIGAHRSGYAELYYFGNPGNYQEYILAFNDGAGDLPAFPPEFPTFGTGQLADRKGLATTEDEPKPELLAEVRASLRINTLVVIASAGSAASLVGYECMGVSQEQVRQIPE